MNFIIVIYELFRMLFFGIQKGIFYKPNGVKLASYLESLGPIFTKFGQLLSTRTDILDAETAKDLAQNLQGKYLLLPRANAHQLSNVILNQLN